MHWQRRHASELSECLMGQREEGWLKPKYVFNIRKETLLVQNKIQNKSAFKFNQNLILPELFSCVMYVTDPLLDGPFDAVLVLFGVVLGLLLAPIPARLTPPVGVRG